MGPQPNQAPVIYSFTATPPSGTAPIDISFSVSADDLDGTIVKYEWDFSYTGVFTADLDTGTTPNTDADPYHFEYGGTYIIAVRVTDDRGGFTIATMNLVLGGNQPPIVSLEADVTSGPPTLTVTFTATASDPDGGVITLYEWDWDYDGATFNAAHSDTINTAIHDFTVDGIYTVAVRVTDDDAPAATAIATIIINVSSGPVNQNPVITMWSGTYSDAGDPPVSGSITGSGAEADTIRIDTPTFPVTVSPTITASDPDGDPISYQWEISQGWGWESNPIPGQTTASLTANNTINSPGVYYVKVLVSDGKGGTVLGRLTVILGGFVEAEFFITDDEAGANYPGPYAEPVARSSGGRGHKYVYRCNVGDTLYFHNDTAITTGLLWNFGDGDVAVDESHPSHSYSAIGIYHVTFSVNTEIPSLTDIAHGVVAVGDATHTVAAHLITWDPGMNSIAPDPADGDYSVCVSNAATPPPTIPTSGVNMEVQNASSNTVFYYACYRADVEAMGIPDTATVAHAAITPYIGREQLYGDPDHLRVYELIGSWGVDNPITAAALPGGWPPNPPDTDYLLSTYLVGDDRLNWGNGSANGNHENPPYHPLPLSVTAAAQKWVSGDDNYGVMVTFNDPSSPRPFGGRLIMSNAGRSGGWPFGMGGSSTLFVEPVLIVIYQQP